MACKDFKKSLYTFTGESACDGWKDISLEECKAKCTSNAVPNAKCPRQGVECAYVQYYHPTRWCHLADETCKPVKESTSAHTILKKRSKFIIHIIVLFH